MESLAHIITTLMMVVSSMTGIGDGSLAASQSPGSSELGISELSPLGLSGGLAMPASGCSGHTHAAEVCDNPGIEIEDPIIRDDEDTEICWDPAGRTDCTLLGDLDNRGPVDGPGCETVDPDSDSTYILVCGDDVFPATLRVLPRVQET